MAEPRPLTASEQAWVAASAAEHRALRKDSRGVLYGLAGVTIAALLVLGLTGFDWRPAALVWLLGAAIGGFEHRIQTRRMAALPTRWDPPTGGWMVQEWALDVTRVETLPGPPEDDQTWAVFHVTGGRCFACSLWDLTLDTTRIPTTVQEVAFAPIGLRMLVPDGPLLPVALGPNPVPFLSREGPEWHPDAVVGYTEPPPPAEPADR